MRFFLLLLFPLISLGADYKLPASTTQAIVGITENWSSSHVNLGIYEKKAGKWQLVGSFWKGRLGRNGSAWGLGSSPTMGTSYRVFSIGDAYGYAPAISKQSGLTYHKVTTKDLWVEDAGSAFYNRHIKLTHEPSSAWEKKQQMRQNDYAHALKLYVGHNTATQHQKAKPGFGSAIFFHIWRANGGKATSGCTTMAPNKLESMIGQIDPKKNPVYILLPRAEYMKYRAKWKLP